MSINLFSSTPESNDNVNNPPEITVEPENTNPDTNSNDPDSQKPKVEKVILNAVPRTLLRSCKAKGTGQQLYHFNFAYTVGTNAVNYASVKLSAKMVIPKGRWCSIFFGAPDKTYICNLSTGGSVTLTAADIIGLFNSNKKSYIAWIKRRDALKRGIITA
ncbi:MAG: hypothetical protein IJ784_12225 [Ruminiclostridium sp.]|nr:hypothetical protein [Ruminiclostridium sp.]